MDGSGIRFAPAAAVGLRGRWLAGHLLEREGGATTLADWTV